MADYTLTVSKDSVSILNYDPSQKMLRGLHEGPTPLQSQRFACVDGFVNGSTFFEPSFRSRTLFQTYFYPGRTKRAVGQYAGRTLYKGSDCPSWLSASFDGLKKHLRNHDRIKNGILDFYLDTIKTDKFANFLITKMHIAFDVETDPNITRDRFFALKFAKSQRINSPFDFYHNEGDGSGTNYIEQKTPKGKKCSTRGYFYEKDMKEGLPGDERLFRFEAVAEGLNNVGDNPEKLIKRLKKVLKQYRLFLFDDIDSCSEFKKQYAENIKKNRSDNVPKKLLREIEQSSTSIPLELTDEIKSWIYNALDKTYRANPTLSVSAYSRRKANPDRIKNCRIRQRLRQLWIREGGEVSDIREKRNRQGIRARNDDLQQLHIIDLKRYINMMFKWEPNLFQLGALKVEDAQFFYTPIFYTMATGPPPSHPHRQAIHVISCQPVS